MVMDFVMLNHELKMNGEACSYRQRVLTGSENVSSVHAQPDCTFNLVIEDGTITFNFSTKKREHY